MCLTLLSCAPRNNAYSELKAGFGNPPDQSRPGVYWYFMDGNRTKEGMTKDLESMSEKGIGSVVFLEVNVGVPRGNVDFLSEEWKDMFRHAVSETERLGIEMTLGIGPGWAGSGGPWVKPEQSMRHLVASRTTVTTPGKQTITLEVPPARRPFFGEGALTPELREISNGYYEDIAVLAFPTPPEGQRVEDTDEKALYYRAPYTSAKGVKQFLPPHSTNTSNTNASNTDTSNTDASATAEGIKKADIHVLSTLLKSDGTLTWDVPEGSWTILRFGARNNGAVTRPAPVPGLGFEADKFDTVSIRAHLDTFVGELLQSIDYKPDPNRRGGLKFLHIDSWEMGAQNWTDDFREEFAKRRGYDPLPYYPVYLGMVVENKDISERFLWDLRLTSQELIVENHAGYVREYAHKHGMLLSIEPYDMTPCADLELGAAADVPMCEFWSAGYGFNSVFSVKEGSSLSHLKGQSIVPAEAFTSQFDGWNQHPGSIKNQTNWAFTFGVNRLVFHTFQHQPLEDDKRPGMTMGPYGIHWDRGQTWWSMVEGFHDYVRKCQFMLQQGRTVSDILFLTPETAPFVFESPESALIRRDSEFLPDHKGYSFDACPPSLLHTTYAENSELVFPSGARYRLLVLPEYETMTVAMLEKIGQLANNGVTVIGNPPSRTPGLAGYPENEPKLQKLVTDIWGGSELPSGLRERAYGKGKILWGTTIKENLDKLYPSYSILRQALQKNGIPENFTSADNNIRYTHRTGNGFDIYFVSNCADYPVSSECAFRITGKTPELWHPSTGETRELTQFTQQNSVTSIPLRFEPYESYFIVFAKDGNKVTGEPNFGEYTPLQALNGAWKVSFEPQWGGPAETTFETLTDWSAHTDEGIKYYSGTATYKQSFELDNLPSERIFLNIGKADVMARVKLNGKNVGILWCAPWRVEITDYVVAGKNELEIDVANLWVNRLVGDLRQSGNPAAKTFTHTTYKHYNADTPLTAAGLQGPVSIEIYK